MTDATTQPRRTRLALLALLAFPCLGADECQDVKGVKVYLSPANHGGTNIGCSGYNEDAGARNVANSAAAYLKSKGFVVKVGQGNYKANYNESNLWGADVHVPIHSNAGTWGCQENSSKSLGGTWGMYRTAGSRGQQLAGQILEAVKGGSPGTNDKLVQRDDLLELKVTARSAYAEMGFHTYYWDTVWLAFGAEEAGAALGKGIHDHCLVVDCRGAAGPEHDDEPHITERAGERPAALFDGVDGRARADIEAGLRPFLAALHPELGDALTAVSEVDDTLVVDLADIRELGSGHHFHASGIPAKVFELGDLDRVVFRIDGEAAPFCDWVESDCLPIARPSGDDEE